MEITNIPLTARPARQDAEGVESLLYSLLTGRMSIEGEPDRHELSAMKVSELRQMCSDRGLLVSGKKDDLINRLLGNEAIEQEA
ncbi:MAG: SAP domain-containing protein, partial [Candidatus Thermoplasmatota archaeon]|nr:SAP domain-containing protein [Candidatus Thermoplasmatota archaeon]